LVVLAAVTALLLFAPTGTVRYWQAWVYLAIFIGASGLTTLYLLRHDRALLERRMHGGPTGEKRPAQKLILLSTSVGFGALLVVPALDHRIGWCRRAARPGRGRGHPGPGRVRAHRAGLSGKHVHVGHHRDHRGSAGDLDRPVRHRPPPDVRERLSVS